MVATGTGLVLTVVSTRKMLTRSVPRRSANSPGTSHGPSEGKSTTLANLAIVLAQSGVKVALVDTDLRRPVQHKIFGLSNRHGLTDAIIQPIRELKDLLQPTNVENLWLLSSGPLPPNPAELLASARLGNIIEELKNYVDLTSLTLPLFSLWRMQPFWGQKSMAWSS